jgi:hypothetical protein
MRTFVSLLAAAFAINLVFTMVTFVFFRGQLKGATGFWDYFHYAVGSLTTSEVAGMIPQTTALRLWTSMYVLTAWVFLIWAAVNHIRNLKLGRLG